MMREWESPGRTWTVTHTAATDPAFDHPLAVIGPVVDAIFVLAQELFEPLRIEADLYAVDVLYGTHVCPAEKMQWCLDAETPTARDWDPPETRVAVERIDRSTIDAFLLGAARQRAHEGEAVCPVALFVTSVRARLPPPHDGAGTVLPIRTEGGTDQLVVERDSDGAWVRGPTSSILTAPIHLYGRTQGLESALTVAAHWSPWFDDGEAGTGMIARALARLDAAGWG